MEFDFWWLPGAALFFALGWLAARKEASQANQAKDPALPEAYVRGLQSLLGEDQLRAIDAFTELARKEPDSLDLHLALGHLFRRKGETDRAIRVHQNLLTRSDLRPEIQANLQRELALDYIKAGLYDRADQSLQALIGSPLELEAQRLRLDLAQRVRDWPLALTLSEGLSNSNADQAAAAAADRSIVGNREALAHLQAHLQVEMAHQLTGQARYEEAFEVLRKAQLIAPDHPRAWIEECLLFIQLSDATNADASAQRLLTRWPEHAARIAAAWLKLIDDAESSDRLLKTRRFELLTIAFRKIAAYDVLQPLVDHLDAQHGPDTARGFLDVEPHASIGLLSVLLRLKRRNIIEQHEEALLGTITRIFEPLAQQTSRYICRHCSFQANRHYWQCPGCHQWDGYPAQRADEVAAS